LIREVNIKNLGRSMSQKCHLLLESASVGQFDAYLDGCIPI